MIHWLMQQATVLPPTALTRAPAGWLSPAEAATFARLIAPKRRSDWLLGRYTAKQLVIQWLQQERPEEAAPRLDAIVVEADRDGAPVVSLNGAPLPVCLSISHSHGTAFCALVQSESGGLRIGADLEFIEQRDPAFVNDFFTAQEQAELAGVPVASHDRLVTATWSAKEAVLKALREGLRIDTRQVECFFPPHDLAPADWAPFTIRLSPALDHPRAAGSWAGWWRHQGDFVLTLAMRTA